MFKEEPGKVNPLYENRLLIFLEDIDKGTFQQILLNPKKFKRVSDAIFTEVVEKDGVREGIDLVRIVTGTREIPSDTFIGCESIDWEDEEHRP